MAEANGAQCACSLRRNCTRAEGNHAGDTGSLCRYCTVRICDRRRRSPWARNRGNLCCVIGQADSRYTSILRNKRRSPRQRCRGLLRLFRKMLVYLLSACPITQHKLPLLRAHGLLRRLSHILTVQYRQREPVSPAWFPSARVQFRRREHAHCAPFASAMVRVRRRKPERTAPFPSAAA